MEEQRKEIEGYECHYLISNIGRVRTQNNNTKYIKI